jgi:ferrous iron transport protein B
MNLKGVNAGSSAKVIKVGGEGAYRQHLLDMGIIPGTILTVVKYAPMGDPVEIRIHSYELTLRLDDMDMIEVETVEISDLPDQGKSPQKRGEHPGLGEGGRFHPKGSGNPLPESEKLSFALVGNQNSGKTTLFNQLAGARQHVGNFPGVTVDRKDGTILGYDNTLLTDLPGIYSMSPYSAEELVSRDFVLNNKPKAIINIVDATNIERNLYLTMQLLEMEIPVVVALNMMDDVIGNGGYIDVMRWKICSVLRSFPYPQPKIRGLTNLWSTQFILLNIRKNL